MEEVHLHKHESSSSGGSLQLTVFSVVMLFGSYLAGSIPLFVPLSGEKLKMVSVLGAGLLLGTALTVIIPEGILTLVRGYSPHQEAIDKPIGIALVLGFLFMLLVDQIATHTSENTSSKKLSWTTTLGLVVHAAADGIALGAAATTNQTDVEIIVFLAIMLHKAPAAFGLVTYLLQQGLERNKVRKHLIIFAFSAPVTSILTFVSLQHRGGGSDTIGATGIAMLFSAGTFLYVATIHVLPEVTSLGGGTDPTSLDTNKNGFSKKELFFLVIGALLPLLLTLGHSHGH
uniref:Zinc transporter ZIP9 n=1 Tax=Caligus clemensi TaxID=344056 RepID=C1C1Y3_CALCM|nr:Zinc transporter ZIP9 [Caligus clemensi]